MTTETKRRALWITASEGTDHLVDLDEHDRGIVERAGRFRARCGAVFGVAAMCVGGRRRCPSCAEPIRPPVARPRLLERLLYRHHPAGPSPRVRSAPTAFPERIGRLPRPVDVPRPLPHPAAWQRSAWFR